MVPSVRRKWWRSAAALPKPLRPAIVSTVASVDSSNSCASSTRWRSSQRYGVVPVSWRKRRAKVRGDMCARSASCSTVISSARCRAIQPSTSPTVSQAAAGSGRWMNWAWPPSRCGGTTIRRAMALATAAPCA